MVSIPLCPLVGKGLGNHFIERTLIDTDILATGALDFMFVYLGIIDLFDAGFMAAKHCAGTDLIISPEFFFTGSTVNCQHGVVST